MTFTLKPREHTGVNLYELSEMDMNKLVEGLSRIAEGSRVTVQTYYEEIELNQYGIFHGAYINGKATQMSMRVFVDSFVLHLISTKYC